MSKCCIGFGKCSCLYFYILLFIVCYHLKRLFSKNEILVMNNHILVKRIYIYFSYILLGSIANYFLNKNLNETEKNITMILIPKHFQVNQLIKIL